MQRGMWPHMAMGPMGQYGGVLPCGSEGVQPPVAHPGMGMVVPNGMMIMPQMMQPCARPDLQHIKSTGAVLLPAGLGLC